MPLRPTIVISHAPQDGEVLGRRIFLLGALAYFRMMLWYAASNLRKGSLERHCVPDSWSTDESPASVKQAWFPRRPYV